MNNIFNMINKICLLLVILSANYVFPAEVLKTEIYELVKLAGAGLDSENSNEQELIKKIGLDLANADLNAQDKTGMTALHWAVQNGINNLAQFLLSQENINADIADFDGCTPLMLAVDKNNILLVDEILKKKPDLCQRRLKGKKQILELITNGSIRGIAKNQLGYTPLMIAATLENRQIVRKLLNAGSNPNLTGYEVSANGRLQKKTSERLLPTAGNFARNEQIKADIGRASQTWTEGGRTLLETLYPLKKDDNKHKLLMYLQFCTCDINQIGGYFQARDQFYYETTKLTAEGYSEGILVQANPLLDACRNGWTDIISKLLSVNANVNQELLNGCSILDMLFQGKRINDETSSDIIKMLISEGADFRRGKISLIRKNIFDDENKE